MKLRKPNFSHVTVHVFVTTLDHKYDVANAIKVESRAILKGTHFCPCNYFEDLKCRSNVKSVMNLCGFFYISFGEVSRMQDYFKSILVVEWQHFRK